MIYEYKILSLSDNKYCSTKLALSTELELNKLGSLGWELVSVIRLEKEAIYYFKRLIK